MPVDANQSGIALSRLQEKIIKLKEKKKPLTVSLIYIELYGL